MNREERQSFLRNEEKLWDMSAMTILSSLVSNEIPPHTSIERLSEIAYDYATGLMKERRRRLKEGDQDEIFAIDD